MVLTIRANFGNWGISVKAFGALVDGFSWSDSSSSASSCDEAVACPAILSRVLLGGIIMGDIWSSCQWSITSPLVSSRHWCIQIFEMRRRCICACFWISASAKSGNCWEIDIFGWSCIFTISLVKVVLVCLEHHFGKIKVFETFSNVNSNIIIKW